MNYLQFHYCFTLPILILLILISRPFLKYSDILSLVFLNVVAVLYTIPWDSFIIRRGVWTYEKDAVVGTFLDIPYEELSFFCIQTTMTSLFTALVFNFNSSPLDGLLKPGRPSDASYDTTISILIFGLRAGFDELSNFNEAWTYFAAIIWWMAFPLAIVWFLAGSYICSHNWRNTLLCIVVPTFYLCCADSYAINHGIWHISSRFTVGIQVPFLNIPVEEAVFFLASNVMVVLGFLCCMRTFAICKFLMLKHPVPQFGIMSFQEQSTLLLSSSTTLIRLLQKKFPSLSILFYTLVEDPSTEYDTLILQDIQRCRDTLAAGSLTFYLASRFYPFPIRDDIEILYAFLRVADDLIDEYKGPQLEQHMLYLEQFIWDLRHDIEFDRVLWMSRLKDENRVAAFHLLTLLRYRINLDFLDELLDAFKFDMEGAVAETWRDCDHYCSEIAGSVGRMVLDLIYSCSLMPQKTCRNRQLTYKIADDVGICLQLINIARDILNDAKSLNRCYVPLEQLPPSERKKFLLKPEDYCQEALHLSKLMVKRAREFGRDFEKGLKLLPRSCRIPIYLGFHFYNCIGTRIDKLTDPTFEEQWRVIVPLHEKLWILVKVLASELLSF